MNPLVTVIIPCRNAEKWLALSIISVLEQGFEDFDIIIVDDGSTDGSVEIIESFMEQDSRIQLIILSEHSGPAIARNIAIKIAKGRYIAFLDADDIWFPTKLEQQISFMRLNNYPLCFSAYEKINEDGDCIGKVGVPDKVSRQELLKTCVIGCLTVVYDKKYFGQVAMPIIKRRQDYGLWLELLKHVEFAYGLNKPLAQYRVHDESLSSSKLKASKYTWILFREVEKLSLAIG